MEQNTGEPSARHPRKCTARSKRSKQLCKRWAMKAQTVCTMHGGKAPRALAKAHAAMEVADMRLRGLTKVAVDALERLLMANSEAVVLGAAKDVLDRARGGGAQSRRPRRSGGCDYGEATLVMVET